MNERIVSIAQELARSDRELSLESLASEHEVSSRTIRNDVKSLNRFLAEKGLGQLEYGPGGVIIVPAEFSRVLASLPVQGFYSYKMSSDERKTLAVVIMASEPGYVTPPDKISCRWMLRTDSPLADIAAAFTGVRFINAPNAPAGEYAFVTGYMSGEELAAKTAGMNVLARYRVLD